MIENIWPEFIMEILSALSLAHSVTSVLMGPFALLGSHLASMVLPWNMWLGEALFPSRREGLLWDHCPHSFQTCILGWEWGWGEGIQWQSLCSAAWLIEVI